MTYDEVEIVANAGVQLREIAERLTVPPGLSFADARAIDLVYAMDAAALSISEVYGQLSALPLDVEDDVPTRALEDYTIATVRREIEARAHDTCGDADPLNRALDIATVRLAWVLQRYPEAGAGYDQTWREDAA